MVSIQGIPFLTDYLVQALAASSAFEVEADPEQRVLLSQEETYACANLGRAVLNAVVKHAHKENREFRERCAKYENKTHAQKVRAMEKFMRDKAKRA